MKDFINLGLASPLLNALTKQGYKKPTPIQIKAIPPALEGKDILGTAQTGTGKTAAFALPILQQILPVLKDKNKRPIRVLILTPTRELAIQIHENISHYGSQTKVFHSVIFGGVGQKPQTDALRRGVDIITATPGRLLDLMNQGYVNLSRIEHFVLDEADRMLDMGFIHDVKKIFSKIPSKRQTLLFSATMPKEVLSLSNFLLKDPIRISVAPVSATAEKVNQKVFFVDQKSKRLLLKSLLKNDKIDISSVLVFTRTKHGANRVVKDLAKNNITAQAIHGNKSQNARQNALDNFKKRITRVLVATDIAARGIDIDDLSHVINYDIPNIPETYVHRIGRTGRAGNSGIAWSFVDTEERKYLSDIQKLIKKEIEIEINHEFRPQSNAGAEKRVQKSKRNSFNEKRFKKNKLKKVQSQKKYHEKKSHAVSGLEKNNSRKENDTSYWGSDSSGSGGAFTKPKN